MSTSSTIATVLGLWLLALAVSESTALAVQVSEQSLQGRLQRSDLVVVALIEATRRVSGHGRVDKIAVAKLVVVVKGSARGTIEFYISSDIAEWELDCCVVGKRYLLFLKKGGAGRYEVVNSKYGAYALGDESN